MVCIACGWINSFSELPVKKGNIATYNYIFSRFNMEKNAEGPTNTFVRAQQLKALLNKPFGIESDGLKDLDQESLPARPLAEGTDVDSSNTSWEQVNGSGGGSSIQCQVVEEEVGGNLTSGPSRTRADATAADIPIISAGYEPKPQETFNGSRPCGRRNQA